METKKSPTKAQQKANRKKWVAALRSGEYKQGTHRLEAYGNFCCLGVLAALSGCEKISPTDPTHMTIYDGQGGSAGPNVRNWVGLTDECGSFTKDGQYADLANLNDHGKTFEEIADIIESEPEGLFTS